MLTNVFLSSRNKLAVAILASIPLMMFASMTQALPSFARQTGEACTACHVQAFGTSLTPRGRDFKLKGYTEGNASNLLPLSLTVQGGGLFDLTSNQDRYSYRPTNSSFFSGSLFYAGRVYDHLGAYVQGSYWLYPDSGRDLGYLDKVDIRFANQFDAAGQHVDYGVSINNEPGVQDLWNTNGVWGTSIIPTFHGFFDSVISPIPLADRGLSGHVVGASAYSLVNKLLYVEAGGYGSLPGDVQKGIGRDNDGLNKVIDGAAAYWRIALQHQWDGHYVSIGHFGLRADTSLRLPNNVSVLAFNPTYAANSDLGVDATYQYLANPEHIFELKGRYVRETRDASQIAFDASTFGFITQKYQTTADSFSIGSTYTWQQTIGLSAGYNQYFFARKFSLFGDDMKFFTAELSYTPFGKSNSWAAPWANLRLSLGYFNYLNTNVLSKFSAIPSDSLYLKGSLAF